MIILDLFVVFWPALCAGGASWRAVFRIVSRSLLSFPSALSGLRGPFRFVSRAIIRARVFHLILESFFSCLVPFFVLCSYVLSSERVLGARVLRRARSSPCLYPFRPAFISQMFTWSGLVRSLFGGVLGILTRQGCSCSWQPCLLRRCPLLPAQMLVQRGHALHAAVKNWFLAEIGREHGRWCHSAFPQSPKIAPKKQGKTSSPGSILTSICSIAELLLYVGY